ncbi:MAG: glycosyltransferase family 39 protein [Chloroflexia bacterium]|nr:glycosyltransferase family 39 protein [Chloroflexia bacterium]
MLEAPNDRSKVLSRGGPFHWVSRAGAIPVSTRLKSVAPVVVVRLWDQFGSPAVAPEATIPLRRRTEIAGLTIVVLVAIILRFSDLSTIPFGVQGDEATAGLEGRRVLDEGWIGVYATSAAGSPTGYFYATAVSMSVFGESIFAIRFPTAFLGTTTVLALFVVLRRNLGLFSAIAGGLLLATSSWHLIFSRIAFPNILWPLIVVLGVGALLEAIRRESWRWWAGAGAVLALGLYAYNGHLLYLGVIGLFITHRLFGWDGIAAVALLGFIVLVPGPLSAEVAILGVITLLFRDPRRFGNKYAHAAAFIVAFCIVALPMAQYAADPANKYFGYGQRLSVFNSAEWVAQDGAGDRLQYVAGRYVDYYDRLCCDLHYDAVDTTGAAPLVPLSALVLAGLGILLATLRRRGPLVTFGIMTLVLAPIASVSTVDFGLRRSLVVVLFFAMFGGLAMVEGVRVAWRFRAVGRIVAIGTISFLFVNTLYRNVDDFFNVTVTSAESQRTLASEMVAATEFLATLEPGSFVYFYSDRWPLGHEIRRYFAPDVVGENRSVAFGEFNFDVDPELGTPVFVFLDRYRENSDIVERLYPGGRYVVGETATDGSGLPSFIAYLTVDSIPAQDEVPGGTPASPPPGASPALDRRRRKESRPSPRPAIRPGGRSGNGTSQAAGRL